MNGLEAVADAIMKFEGWSPGTRAYKNRNPGNLEDAEGNCRVFPSLVEGYSALLDDLSHKFLGHTKSRLGPDSTILALMMVYAPPADNNPTQAYADFICGWCTKALGKTIVTTTPLKEIWSLEP